MGRQHGEVLTLCRHARHAEALVPLVFPVEFDVDFDFVVELDHADFGCREHHVAACFGVEHHWGSVFDEGACDLVRTLDARPGVVWVALSAL